MSSEVSVDWIQERLQTLTEYSTELWNVAPNQTNDFSSWSALKLILLSATVEMYTRIVPNYTNNFYYIDALAGSGISAFPDQDEYFVGSAIIAATMAHSSFNRMYLIEQDQQKAAALRERLDFLKDELDEGFACDDYRVIERNTNAVIPDIVEEIREETLYQSERVNTLNFIDNQGLDVEFSTIRTLSSIYGDLLINFPTTAIRRTAGAGHDTKMNKFYGNTAWKSAGTDDDRLRTIYMGNLADMGRPVQEYVPVQSGGSYFYDMIYCTRETANNSPYISVVEHMREKIGNITGDDVEQVLSFMRGEQTQLHLFDQGDDDKQTGLSDFF